MKNYFNILLPMVSGFLFSQNVGIRTTSPTEKFDVNGSVAIGTSVYLDPNTYTANPNGFDVIAVDPQSSVVNGKVMKVETLYTPIIIQPYSINNIYRDDLNNLDLQISSEKYMVAITNFEAIPSSTNSSQPNNGVYSTSDVKGHFVIRAFESDGTWRINIGYPTLNTQYTSGRYTYNFDVILLSKRFFKVLNQSVTTYNLRGDVIGDAGVAPSGI
ncbi:hypothetical protein [Epilithonimonas xixisoli]|uniref:Uncharacterized protein n=1 Tax=Epilithonimonas xixisoli TaxID=1476462 RepID=A0A4R8IBT9_9FLAO|nr:hypothetical protein [Epilithonimonas xixisoli]TDX87184.1 hypothetical protein B0I22_1367 [Epilithonimonas xixisoli]